MNIRIGDCRILERIGEGGFGDVYKAVQTTLDRTVAFKTLRPELARDSYQVAGFKAQARLGAKLEHPNIVRVYDYGFEEGYHYITMQYVDGQTLDSVLLKRGALTPAEVISIARQIAEALEYAHRKEVMHGDLNPSNVMLTADGQVCVTDFGGFSPTSAVERVVGVPEYVSPEQARGATGMLPSDIYSFGVIVYHMLAGRPPFSGVDTRATLHAHISAKVPPLKGLEHKVPDRLGKLVLRMLSKDPESRPRAAEVKEMLLNMSATTKPVKIKKERIRRPASRGRKFAAAAVVPFGAACWLVGTLLFQAIHTERSIDDFVAVQGTALAKNRAAQESQKRREAEYGKELVRGQDLYREKRYGLAEEAFIRASHLKSKSTDPRMFLAALYIDRGEYGRAAWHLRRVLQLDPRKREAQNALRFVQSKLQAAPVELTPR